MRVPVRFNLILLLIVITAASIAFAVIWQFWPQYRAYRERVQFETAASQLTDGMNVAEIMEVVGRGTSQSYSSNASGELVATVPYFMEGAWYCIHAKLQRPKAATTSSTIPATSICVYRLKVPPVDYQPQTQAAKDEVFPTEEIRTLKDTPNGPVSIRAPNKTGEVARRAAYIEDFYQVIAGYEESGLGIEFEKLPRIEVEAP
jgi:hypothetical protein